MNAEAAIIVFRHLLEHNDYAAGRELAEPYGLISTIIGRARAAIVTPENGMSRSIWTYLKFHKSFTQFDATFIFATPLDNQTAGFGGNSPRP